MNKIGIGTNGYYWADMRDREFGAEMPTREGLLKETLDVFECLLRSDMKNRYIYLPITKLKPKKGCEICEFEISDELNEEIMSFIKAGGEIKNG